MRRNIINRLKPISIKQWIQHGEKHLYVFGKLIKNQYLHNIINYGIYRATKWKVQRVKYLYKSCFIETCHPPRIAYILETSSGLGFSTKNAEILKEYSKKNNLDWYWIH